MVFFNCDACGEALKKNQVEKHTYKCNSNAFSCIDCQVVFTCASYVQHIKCVSENQKYGASGYVEKAAKGELKQNAWVEQVQAAIECVKDPNLKKLLKKIEGYSNIPRKEAKFVNFLTNSCSIRDKRLCQAAWNAIAAEAEKNKANNQENATNGKNAPETPKPSEKLNEMNVEPTSNGVHSQACDAEQTIDASSTAELLPFKWRKAIKRKLQEAGGEMKLKKLRKTLAVAYCEKHGLETVDDTVLRQMIEETLGNSGGLCRDGKKVILASAQENGDGEAE